MQVWKAIIVKRLANCLPGAFATSSSTTTTTTTSQRPDVRLSHVRHFKRFLSRSEKKIPQFQKHSWQTSFCEKAQTMKIKSPDICCLNIERRRQRRNKAAQRRQTHTAPIFYLFRAKIFILKLILRPLARGRSTLLLCLVFLCRRRIRMGPSRWRYRINIFCTVQANERTNGWLAENCIQVQLWVPKGLTNFEIKCETWKGERRKIILWNVFF